MLYSKLLYPYLGPTFLRGPCEKRNTPDPTIEQNPSQQHETAISNTETAFQGITAPSNKSTTISTTTTSID